MDLSFAAERLTKCGSLTEPTKYVLSMCADPIVLRLTKFGSPNQSNTIVPVYADPIVIWLMKSGLRSSEPIKYDFANLYRSSRVVSFRNEQKAITLRMTIRRQRIDLTANQLQTMSIRTGDRSLTGGIVVYSGLDR